MRKKNKQLRAGQVPTLGEQLADLQQRVAEAEVTIARTKAEIAETDIRRQLHTPIPISSQWGGLPFPAAFVRRPNVTVTPALAASGATEEQVGTHLLNDLQVAVLKNMGVGGR